MLEIIVDILLGAMAVYIGFGILFSVFFLFRGVHMIDDGVKGTPWHFKLLIWPGTVLMWSVLLTRILRK